MGLGGLMLKRKVMGRKEGDKAFCFYALYLANFSSILPLFHLQPEMEKCITKAVVSNELDSGCLNIFGGWCGVIAARGAKRPREH